MKTYDEIKDIITNRFGLKCLDDYKKFLARYQAIPRQEPKATKEDIEALSPDNINCYDFWKVCEELFGTDAVCNSVLSGAPKPYIEMDCNRGNISLAESFGMLSILRLLCKRAPQSSFLEIGTGYGAVKNWVETNTYFYYTGIDVYPKIAGVERTSPDGTFTEEQKSKSYDIVFSSNVFQHLTPRQVLSYFANISKMLTEKGCFIFSAAIAPENPAENQVEADGKAYLRHYGQFTEMPDFFTLKRVVYSFFEVSHTSKINETNVSFVCWKKTPPKPVETPVAQEPTKEPTEEPKV